MLDKPYLKQKLGNVERNKKGRMYFVDSTDLGACRDHNIHNHKLFNGFAGSGKTTVRQFYGFKLRGMIVDEVRIVNVYISIGNIYEDVVLKMLLREVKGIFVADTGFLIKEEKLK